MLLNGIMANITTIAGIEKGMKEWFVTTPATALLTDGQVRSAWGEKGLGLDIILGRIAQNAERAEELSFSASTYYSADSLS